MTSLTTSSENVLKGTSDKRKTLLKEEQPERDERDAFSSITARSPVLCDTPTEKTSETKKKKRKSTNTNTCNHKRTNWIHSTKVETQEDRDKYNEQQRKWRADRLANDPSVKEKHNQYRKKNRDRINHNKRELRKRNKNKINQYHRDWILQQKANNSSTQQSLSSLPVKTKSRQMTAEQQRIEKNKIRRAYYRKNAPGILRKQKESYKEAKNRKKAKDNADFEKLMSAKTQLLDSFKKESKKLTPTLSDQVFIRFLCHVVAPEYVVSPQYEAKPKQQKAIVLKSEVGDISDCDNGIEFVEYSGDESDEHSVKQGLTEWEYERDREISSSCCHTGLMSWLAFKNLSLASIEESKTTLRPALNKKRKRRTVTNCIGLSDKQQYNFKLCRNLLHPTSTQQSRYLMEHLSWTPTSKTVNKDISYNIVLTRDEFDRLVQPGWLNDNLLDFLFRYLLRGICPDDLIYGIVGCSKYQWIRDIKHIKQCKGKKRWSKTSNVLNNELTFMPLNINDNHWVLAVLFLPKLVATRQAMDKGLSCILYFDPMNKHLSPDPEVVINGILERKTIHDNLLRWLNWELGDENNPIFDCQTFPLLYAFANDKWPTQPNDNWYDCGCYVFHFGYGVARWYDGWRCKKSCSDNNRIESLTTSIETTSFLNDNIQDGDDLAFQLRVQISALIHSLDERPTINDINPHYPQTNFTTPAKRDDGSSHKKSLKKTAERSMVTRNSGANNRSRNTIQKCPSLHSSHFKPELVDKSLINLFTTFVKRDMSSSFTNYFHTIIPLTNSCRMNYQSKQAIRVFYGMTQPTKTQSKEYDVRSVYGSLAVLKSTGGHPSDSYKVFPFTPRIEEMSNGLTTFLKSKGLTNNSFLPFNFLEIKIYLGDDIFISHCNNAILDSDGNPLRLGCNKQVNSHNDLNFSDEGVQSLSDTASGDQPTVTFTIGSTRRLIFDHMTKNPGLKCWSTVDSQQSVSFDLKHGSVFVLSPEDDKPSNLSRLNTTKHKTKHRAEFGNNGISFAFVFRRVKNTSKFNPVDNTWLWRLESKKTKQKIEEYIRNNGSKHDMFRRSNQCLEIRSLDSNIRSFISNIQSL